MIVPKPIDPEAVVGKVSYRADCDRESEYTQLCAMPVCDEYFVQNDCQHNQYLAAVNRVACKWPAPDPKAIGELRWVIASLASRLGPRSKVSFDVWGKHYTGLKRARYLRAIESLENRPIGPKDSGIQAFVKLEKLTDPRKDPRMIQMRGARYNVELGNYLKAFEHDLYTLRGMPHDSWFPEGRLIVKGMNNAARGALIERHWNSLRRPVQLSLDCSRFDGHVSEPLLRIEHSLYESLFRDPALQRLLGWQRRNTCFTRSGLKYTVFGRRMSGDMNTALGNCVLMITMMAWAMRQLGLRPSQWRMADDGDDCCIMVEEEHAHLVANGLQGLFLRLGHDLKVEGIARTLEEVTLCAGRPIRVGGQRVMVLNPRRAIGKSRVGIKSRDPRFMRDYVHTMGVCQLALYSGVPVLQAHALALKRAGTKTLRELPGAYLYRLAHMERPDLVQATAISEEARLDFAVAFGIDIQSQLAAEEWFDQLTAAQLLGLAPPKEVPL
jgi:hypothetical protein